jgi:hypothetical protein
VTRLLVVGIPRSGTTWIGEVLGATKGTRFVKEPDGDHEPFAYAVRKELGNYPELAPGDRSPRCERLWDGAFAGGVHASDPRDRAVRWLYRSSPVGDRWRAWFDDRESVRLRLVAALARPLAPASTQNIVVKSVRASFCTEWLADRYHPTVLVVHRHPLNSLASWAELGYGTDARQLRRLDDVARRRWNVKPPPADASLVRRQAFAIGVLIGGLADAAAAHPEWHRVEHEHLCSDTPARFEALATEVGLVWSDESAERVTRSNTDGTGYQTQRVAETLPDRWRDRLDDDAVAEASAEWRRFPFAVLPPVAG